MSGPTISVAMCTFNGGRFLTSQLESIAAQELPPDELVICDDGSSDGSIRNIENFSRRTAFPVRLLVNEHKLGSTKNFENAISLCKSEIVVLADQDDVWYRHKLRRITEIFRQSITTIAAFSDADLIVDDLQPINSRLWTTVRFTRAEQSDVAQGNILRVLIKHPVVTGATMAFRRKMFDLITPIPSNEIHDRWISFLLAVYGPFQAISEPLMQYRRHAAQQIGPGPLDVHEAVIQASNRGADFYFDEITRFSRFRDALQERRNSFPDAERAIKEVENKIRHLEHRAKLSRMKIARIPQMLGEIINGNYWRYSGGWRSLAKDFILR